MSARDERDADAQLSAARAAALAWLRATLAALPAAVTSLSVGAEFTDANDQPMMEPRLNASLRRRNGVVVPYPGFPSDIKRNSTAPGWAEVDAIDDDLRTHTRPFLFALGDDEWFTVTRADLAPKIGFHDAQPIAAADGPVLAAIMQEIADLPRGEATTILCHRNTDGTLTWNVTAP